MQNDRRRRRNTAKTTIVDRRADILLSAWCWLDLQMLLLFAYLIHRVRRIHVRFRICVRVSLFPLLFQIAVIG